MTHRKYVYGPVASRRFGLSLGVDPLPPKTCCYDCVYCQQGRTTRLTRTREEFVPLDDVLADARQALTSGPAPEVVTLAGSGEPTLYGSLGELIEGLHALCSVPIILLTNGALLDDPDVRRAAARADIICPSLDAADEETFRRTNRPHPDIDFERMLDGLRTLRQEAPGRLDLEVFIARSINDSPEHLDELAKLTRSIEPDAIQLNTAVRPTPGRRGLALDADEMKLIAEIFGRRAEVIASFDCPARARSITSERDVLDVLERRPCTPADLSMALGLHINEVAGLLDEMQRAGRVEPAGDEGYWRKGGKRKP